MKNFNHKQTTASFDTISLVALLFSSALFGALVMFGLMMFF